MYLPIGRPSHTGACLGWDGGFRASGDESSSIRTPEEGKIFVKLRIALVAALAGSALFAGAAPASASCNPEKPSTCEAELPQPNCVLYYSIPGGGGSIDYCWVLKP